MDNYSDNKNFFLSFLLLNRIIRKYFYLFILDLILQKSDIKLPCAEYQFHIKNLQISSDSHIVSYNGHCFMEIPVAVRTVVWKSQF